MNCLPLTSKFCLCLVVVGDKRVKWKGIFEFYVKFGPYLIWLELTADHSL